LYLFFIAKKYKLQRYYNDKNNKSKFVFSISMFFTPLILFHQKLKFKIGTGKFLRRPIN